MANNLSNSSAPAGLKTAGAESPVYLRSWPKIVLLIPTFFMSLICGVVMRFYDYPQGNAFTIVHLWGLIFLLVLAINLAVLLYDLSLRGFLIVVLLIVTLVLAISLLSEGGSVWRYIGKALSVRVFANSAFYFMLCLVLWFNFAIAWVITRFNYWKVEHNEIIIHKGFMQEQERHPTAQARFKLVIDDIVEYAILGSGKLVFYFGDDATEHELPNILLVHRKAKKLDELLGRVAVVSHG